jgi:hypothetical protein
MYFKDHAPPHFHVITQSNEAVQVVIETLVILAGEADALDIAEALAWAEDNRETLRQWWREYSE